MAIGERKECNGSQAWWMAQASKSSYSAEAGRSQIQGWPGQPKGTLFKLNTFAKDWGDVGAGRALA